jgi:CO/xanthine dehydrogenase FAD-binding subunit
MDLNTVTALLRPADRTQLAGRLGRPGVAPLAGGTWLFSEPQPALTTLVDLTALGWPPLTAGERGLEIAATCTLAELAAWAESPARPAGWPALGLTRPCCEALAGSFKIWHTATVGGNICLALPAGPMTSLAVALDGVAVLWGPDGPGGQGQDQPGGRGPAEPGPHEPGPHEPGGWGQDELDSPGPDGGDPAGRRVPVAEFVRGNRLTALAPGEVLRAVELPAAALRARTAFRRASLAGQGRSGSVVIGRRDTDGDTGDDTDGDTGGDTSGDDVTDGGFVLTVTAAVDRPHRLAFPAVPTAGELTDALAGIEVWFDDPHGAPDWRRAVTGLLAEQVRAELAEPA